MDVGNFLKRELCGLRCNEVRTCIEIRFGKSSVVFVEERGEAFGNFIWIRSLRKENIGLGMRYFPIGF